MLLRFFPELDWTDFEFKWARRFVISGVIIYLLGLIAPLAGQLIQIDYLSFEKVTMRNIAMQWNTFLDLFCLLVLELRANAAMELISIGLTVGVIDYGKTIASNKEETIVIRRDISSPDELFTQDSVKTLRDRPIAEKGRSWLTSGALDELTLNGRDIHDLDFYEYASLNALAYANGKLSKCRFTETYLIGSKFTNAEFRETAFIRSHFSDELKYSVFKYCDFGTSQFDGSYLMNSEFRRCQSTGGSLVDAKLEGTYFRESKFQGADFQRAKLQNAKFESADLSNAKFSGAEFRQTSFAHVDFTNANFSYTNLKDTAFTYVTLSGCDFRGTDLSKIVTKDRNGEDLINNYDWSESKYNATTKFPANFDPKQARMMFDETL